MDKGFRENTIVKPFDSKCLSALHFGSISVAPNWQKGTLEARPALSAKVSHRVLSGLLLGVAFNQRLAMLSYL